MRVLIEYAGGYGWHIGRLLLWPLLLVAGVAATFVLEITSQFACAVYKWPGSDSFLPPHVVPLACSVMIWGSAIAAQLSIVVAPFASSHAH